ncbi:hypothetical protein Ddc_17586 [Ditylenchus destructor]|nr:hypothetical protein Ddc_17586 [Ditylenchus destructor]
MDRCSLESLPTELLLKILTGLNRRELLKLSAASKTIGHFIALKFPSEPILTLGSLHRNDYGIWRYAKRNPRTGIVDMSPEMVSCVKKWKFLRFRETELAFSSYSDPRPYHDVIRSVGHVWDNGYLCIAAKHLGPTEEISRLFATSREPDLIIDGIVEFLPQFLSGNTDEFMLNDDSPTVPSIGEQDLNKIVDFLFRPPKSKSSRTIVVSTMEPLSRQTFDRIIEKISEVKLNFL